MKIPIHISNTRLDGHPNICLDDLIAMPKMDVKKRN